MYEVHFRRHLDSKEDFVCTAKGILTLAEARKKRRVSGDLVVHRGTHEIVMSEEWLWEWEKKDPHSYARKAISTDRRILVGSPIIICNCYE